jgi:hypothetical protein
MLHEDPVFSITLFLLVLLALLETMPLLRGRGPRGGVRHG